jgi:hypothetical protein
VAQIGRGKEPAPFTRAADRQVEKNAEAKKSNGHLRTVPSPMSLPFFDASDSKPDNATGPVTLTSATLAGQERVKLKALLSELEGLKKKLHRARRKAP